MKIKILNNNGQVTLYGCNNTFLFDMSYEGIDLFNSIEESRYVIDIRTQNLSDDQIQAVMVALKESGFVYVFYHGGTALHIHANVNTN